MNVHYFSRSKKTRRQIATMSDNKLDLITIGAGPAGYAAAIYATRYKLENLIIAKELGGLMMYSDIVENYPGFPSIKGNELMDNFKQHSDSLNIEIVEESVESIEKKGDDFLVKTGKKA